jgi:hypothetical protein
MRITATYKQLRANYNALLKTAAEAKKAAADAQTDRYALAFRLAQEFSLKDFIHEGEAPKEALYWLQWAEEKRAGAQNV